MAKFKALRHTALYERLSKDEKKWMEEFQKSANASPSQNDKKGFFRNLFGG